MPPPFQVYAMCFPYLICTTNYYYELSFPLHKKKKRSSDKIDGVSKVFGLILKSISTAPSAQG